MGGAQSLHTKFARRAYALPSEHAVTIALRTQQVIAYESGVTAAVDPLGGSYHLEHLTARRKGPRASNIDRIDAMGGMIAAIEQGSRSARSPKPVTATSGRLKLVIRLSWCQCVPVEWRGTPSRSSRSIRQRTNAKVAKLAALRKRRDRRQVTRSLDSLRRAAQGTDNTMPYIPGCRPRLRDVGRDL